MMNTYTGLLINNINVAIKKTKKNKRRKKVRKKVAVFNATNFLKAAFMDKFFQMDNE